MRSTERGHSRLLGRMHWLESKLESRNVAPQANLLGTREIGEPRFYNNDMRMCATR